MIHSRVPYIEFSLPALMILVCLVFSAFARYETDNHPKGKPFSLVSSLDEIEVKLGEEIALKLELKNDDSRIIEVVEPLSLRNGIRLEVLDKKGKRLALSENAAKRLSYPSVGSRFIRKIPAKSSFKYEIDLREYFDLQPGRYRILSWRSIFVDGKVIEVESNPVEVHIVKALPNRIAENQRLIRILQNTHSRPGDDNAITLAIVKLGKRKSVEAIPSLISLLDFESKLEIDESEFSGRFFDESLSFPAVRALASIGRPALPSFVEILETEPANSLKSKNAMHVFALFYQDDLSRGLEFLDDLARKGQDSNSKQNLRIVYRRLKAELEKLERVFTESSNTE